MQVLCLYGPRKFKPRLESELSKQQYTVTLFDCNHLTHVIVLFANAKIYVTVQFLLCFILDLRTISEYRPPGVDLEARFAGFFLGGGGLMHGEVIFGILRYILI